MAAHEGPEAGCEIARPEERLGDGQRAHGVVGEAAVRVKQLEVGRRPGMALEARPDDVARYGAEHFPFFRIRCDHPPRASQVMARMGGAAAEDAGEQVAAAGEEDDRGEGWRRAGGR
jgi:hypothetical protein